MKFIRGLHNLPASLKNCVATMGNFDGVHSGHQALLKQLITLAEQYKLPAILITFEPMPTEYFLKGKAPARLMRLREKLKALKNFSIDYVLCLHFDETLSQQSAEAFTKNILVDKLNIKAILVGDEFRYGAKRAGD